MSLLAPLYALGALAVSLPVIFHLIQRRPRGQVPFGSLMFLTPSPPRLTRRSRLDNLPLLLLRALALILLAMAFSRPLLRSFAGLDVEPPARRLVLLVDTSASMRRDGLWAQATDHVNRLLDDLQPEDRLAMLAFDTNTRPLVRFDDLSANSPRERAKLLRDALQHTSPTWAATNVDQALATAVDLLQTADETETDGIPAQIVLISDLQQSSRLEQLKGIQWPADVQLDIQRVANPETTNARAVILDRRETTEGDSDQIAVRVHNASDSVEQQFRLGWVDDTGKLLDEREFSVQVPPGGNRLIRIPRSLAASEQLALIGDDHQFDNTAFVARPSIRDKTLLYLGDESDDPRSSLLYFLRRASLDTPRQTVQLVQHAPTKRITRSLLSDVPLVVAGDAIAAEDIGTIRDYIETGGRLLYVLCKRVGEFAAETACLEQLTSWEDITIDEAKVRDYAMLAKIDFQHPLFQPLADPRFNDFTKIRFWSHRIVSTAAEAPWKVLASFDDQSPALIEQRMGNGRLWILAAGWQPDESQLALSTKFIPLLAEMFQWRPDQQLLTRNYDVGEDIALTVRDTGAQLILADGTTRKFKPAGSGRSEPQRLDTPGIYRFVQGEDETPFAVNVATRESRTAPLDTEIFEQYGVQLGRALTMAEIQAQRRRLRDVELESRQKLWRWLVVGAIAVLGLETWLGGRASRSSATVEIAADDVATADV